LGDRAGWERSRGRGGESRMQGTRREIGRKGRESMKLRGKKKRMRPGEKMMVRDTTINQNDTKEYLHSLLDAEEAIKSNRKPPEREGRLSKRDLDSQRKARRRG
jgi:hypothetical protein